MKHIPNNKNMYVVAYYFVNVKASIIISILTRQKPSCYLVLVTVEKKDFSH
ncbi:hypothetical protein B296_00018290 [Ensete ventricosum]|uniref:Uncharacterized protein n=1 Tax=Ensete ventricosum TaxID=4639 RepID=A0A427ANA5_ENSVE|nr:hypothetical protein B296_00018290 [Ensete ventricosum]